MKIWENLSIREITEKIKLKKLEWQLTGLLLKYEHSSGKIVKGITITRHQHDDMSVIDKAKITIAPEPIDQ